MSDFGAKLIQTRLEIRLAPRSGNERRQARRAQENGAGRLRQKRSAPPPYPGDRRVPLVCHEPHVIDPRRAPAVRVERTARKRPDAPRPSDRGYLARPAIFVKSVW
jgi:hypothetical protein